MIVSTVGYNPVAQPDRDDFLLCGTITCLYQVFMIAYFVVQLLVYTR